MTDTQQRAAAKAFAEYWKGKGYEKGESQAFWLSLLRDVYGVEHPEQFITFEEQVHLDHTSFIDASIPSTHVLIEQKGLGKDLKKPIKQSVLYVISEAFQMPYITAMGNSFVANERPVFSNTKRSQYERTERAHTRKRYRLYSLRGLLYPRLETPAA
ncbi:MAG: hypothetical protein LIO57_08040 [Oscillospiraceae bacterium]|nr:hypothetical protein [Oscillospiraceae bacterium]